MKGFSYIVNLHTGLEFKYIECLSLIANEFSRIRKVRGKALTLVVL